MISEDLKGMPKNAKVVDRVLKAMRAGELPEAIAERRAPTHTIIIEVNVISM